MKLARVVIAALLSAACATSGAHPAPHANNARAALRFAIDSMVRQTQFRDAQFGVLIVDPERGDTLYSLNAGKLFMPASNMKIVTSATSLVQLGPDYTFHTDFAAGGPVVRDTLQGALIVNGRGDPTISDHMRGSAMNPLYEVADSLRAHGSHDDRPRHSGWSRRLSRIRPSGSAGRGMILARTTERVSTRSTSTRDSER